MEKDVSVIESGVFLPLFSFICPPFSSSFCFFCLIKREYLIWLRFKIVQLNIIDLQRLLDIESHVCWDIFWGLALFTACLKWKCLRFSDVIYQACHPKITGALPVLVLEQQCSWTTNHQKLPLTNNPEVFMCVNEEAEGMAFVCEIDVVCPSKYVSILLKRLVTDICCVLDADKSGPPSKTGLH